MVRKNNRNRRAKQKARREAKTPSTEAELVEAVLFAMSLLDKPIPEIHTYISVNLLMKFRAAREGVAFDLNPNFFRCHLAKGIQFFFGVKTDQDGKVLADTKKPGILVEFREPN